MAASPWSEPLTHVNYSLFPQVFTKYRLVIHTILCDCGVA